VEVRQVIPLIGLSGYSNCGKSAVAQMLTEHGYTVAEWKVPIVAMTEEINPIVGTTPGWDGQLLRYKEAVATHGYDAAKDAVPGVAHALIDIGLAARKIIHEDVWVNVGLANAPELSAWPDTRFPNEAQAIVDRGGQVWRIDRPGYGPRMGTDGTPSKADVAIDDWPFDLRIVNDGTLASLRDKVLHALDGVLAGV
jgi:hypothetical protein